MTIIYSCGHKDVNNFHKDGWDIFRVKIPCPNCSPGIKETIQQKRDKLRSLLSTTTNRNQEVASPRGGTGRHMGLKIPS